MQAPGSVASAHGISDAHRRSAAHLHLRPLVPAPRQCAVELDPVEPRLRTGEFETALMGGFFGAIRDIMPDAWGRRALERCLQVGQLDEFDYLLRTPDDQAGAFGFGLGREPPSASLT